MSFYSLVLFFLMALSLPWEKALAQETQGKNSLDLQEILKAVLPPTLACTDPLPSGVAVDLIIEEPADLKDEQILLQLIRLAGENSTLKDKTEEELRTMFLEILVHWPEKKREPLQGYPQAIPEKWFLNCGRQFSKNLGFYNLDTYFTHEGFKERSRRGMSSNVPDLPVNRRVTKERDEAEGLVKALMKTYGSCRDLNLELEESFKKFHLAFKYPPQVFFDVPKENITYLTDISPRTPQLVKKWLLTQGNFSEVHGVKYLAQGGSSYVFSFRPSKKEKKVAKILNGKGRGEEYLKAEWARGQVLSQLADKFTVNGKKLLTVNPLDLSFAHQGVLLQNFVQGPTAHEFGQVLLEEQEGKEEAKKKLLEWGFPDPAKAREHLEILETFYQASFGIGYKISTHKSIGLEAHQVPQNYYSPRAAMGGGIVVGFDYNHGANVIWNKKKKRWVIIDW